MLYSSKEWLEKLKDTPFPILDCTPKRIKEVIHKKSANYTELADIIRLDPGFCLQILRAINRTLNKKKEPLFSINQAISLLGMTWLEAHFEHFPRLSAVNRQTDQQSIAACYSRILYATHYATYYARLRRDPQPNELATAILLEHIAEISLWLHEPEVAQKILQLPSYGSDRDEASLNLFQTITLDKLNQSLITEWNMPQLNSESRKNCVKLSSAISQASSKNWYGHEMEALLKEGAQQTQKSVDELSAGIHSQAAETARSIHELGLICPIYNLIFGPTFALEKNQPTHQKQIKSATKSVSAGTPPHQPIPHKAPQKTKQADGLDAIITRAMQQLHEDSVLQRVAFIQLSPDKKELRVRKLIDKIANSKLRQFRIEAQQSNIFGLLLSKPHQLWMHKENLKKHAKLLPKAASEILESPEFFIASLFNQQHAIGIIYADNGPTGTPLNQTIRAHFTRICQQISNEAKQRKKRSSNIT